MGIIYHGESGIIWIAKLTEIIQFNEEDKLIFN